MSQDTSIKLSTTVGSLVSASRQGVGLFFIAIFGIGAVVWLWLHGIHDMTDVIAEPYFVAATLVGSVIGIGLATLTFARSELRVPTAAGPFANKDEMARTLVNLGFQSVSNEREHETLEYRVNRYIDPLLTRWTVELATSESSDSIRILGPRFIMRVLRQRIRAQMARAEQQR